MVQERKDHEIITDPREQEKLTELAEKTQKAISAQSEAAGKAIQALVGLFVSSAKDKLPHTLPSRIMIYRQAREDLAWP